MVRGSQSVLCLEELKCLTSLQTSVPCWVRRTCEGLSGRVSARSDCHECVARSHIFCAARVLSGQTTFFALVSPGVELAITVTNNSEAQHLSNGETPPVSALAARQESNLSKCFQQIREMIVHGRLAPGTRIVEAELAERLGVSRTPVRGALHLLYKEGYIVSAPAGSRKTRLAVAALTNEDARELYSIVGHLEGLAAASTARLEPVSRAAVVGRLRELNQQLRELAEARRSEPNRIFELDMNFHETIVEASAGPRLRALHGSVKPQTERYWRLYATAILDQLGISVGEHLLIIQAVTTGDAAAAERAVQINWENGAERLCRVIDTLGERGSW
jgi:DNA-binding GntR family transcriptional regulator